MLSLYNGGNIPDIIPEISINDVTVLEEFSLAAQITVSLSEPISSPVTVNYSTANNSATAGNDYEAKSGTLTFAANQTSQTIHVIIYADNRIEWTESFFVNLSNPSSNATLADNQGIVTIVELTEIPIDPIDPDCREVFICPITAENQIVPLNHGSSGEIKGQIWYDQQININLGEQITAINFGNQFPTNTNEITGTSAGDVLTGNDSNDIITGQQGADTITTGNGNDQIIYSFCDLGDRILDFDPNYDQLVLTQLINSIGYEKDTPFDDGYLRLVEGNGGTNLQLDVDGIDGRSM